MIRVLLSLAVHRCIMSVCPNSTVKFSGLISRAILGGNDGLTIEAVCKFGSVVARISMEVKQRYHQKLLQRHTRYSLILHTEK